LFEYSNSDSCSHRHSFSHNEMIEEIKHKRELMIKSANTLGFTSEVTVRYSQELDELINEYHRMTEHETCSKEEIKFAFKEMILVWPKVLV